MNIEDKLARKRAQFEQSPRAAGGGRMEGEPDEDTGERSPFTIQKGAWEYESARESEHWTLQIRPQGTPVQISRYAPIRRTR